jgi:hypothetical protein
MLKNILVCPGCAQAMAEYTRFNGALKYSMLPLYSEVTAEYAHKQWQNIRRLLAVRITCN